VATKKPTDGSVLKWFVEVSRGEIMKYAKKERGLQDCGGDVETDAKNMYQRICTTCNKFANAKV
jgi:hypothetical protein